jgi:signal transduction histidine kinase
MSQPSQESSPPSRPGQNPDHATECSRLRAEIATLRHRADRAVSDRKLAEEALRRAEKLALVGRLASSISHEINNPLESVVNLLYLIEHSAPAHSDSTHSHAIRCEDTSAEIQGYARLAASELQRVSRIVTHTLAFHRQADEVQLCPMSAILESVIGLFQGRLNATPVQLHHRLDPEDTVPCLPGDLRQVFANLVGNALDALDAVPAALIASRSLWLRTRRSHNWLTGEPGLRVTIADNGSGMSETTRKKLFEAFYTTKPNTGTGLGLWISDGIVRSHGGRVQVRSSQARSSQTPGPSGTVFTIFLPAGKVS